MPYHLTLSPIHDVIYILLYMIDHISLESCMLVMLVFFFFHRRVIFCEQGPWSFSTSQRLCSQLVHQSTVLDHYELAWEVVMLMFITHLVC